MVDKTVTVTESAKIVPKPPVVDSAKESRPVALGAPGTVVKPQPGTIISPAPQTTAPQGEDMAKKQHTVLRAESKSLGSPGTVLSPNAVTVTADHEGDARLKTLVDKAEPPCTFCVNNEHDYTEVQRLLLEKKGDYHVKLVEGQEARALWRKRK